MTIFDTYDYGYSLVSISKYLDIQSQGIIFKNNLETARAGRADTAPNSLSNR